MALEKIRDRVRSGSSTSAEDRALARVCDLRRAVASGEWLTSLPTNCHSRLATARFALNEIGAMSVAAYLSETMAALRHTIAPHRRHALLVKLERDLNAAGPILDALIAERADALLTEEEMVLHTSDDAGAADHAIEPGLRSIFPISAR